MLAEKNGIPTSEAPFTMQELADADEIIVSSSGGLCIQAVELDGKPIGGKRSEDAEDFAGCLCGVLCGRYEGTVKIHKFSNQGLSLKTWQLFFRFATCFCFAQVRILAGAFLVS